MSINFCLITSFFILHKETTGSILVHHKVNYFITIIIPLTTEQSYNDSQIESRKIKQFGTSKMIDYIE